MPKDFREMERSNRSANPYIRRLSSPERRLFVRGSMAVAVSGVLANRKQCPGIPYTPAEIALAAPPRSTTRAAARYLVQSSRST